MEFQAVSGPKFTGPFPLNAGGIAIGCNVGRCRISSAVPEIFAIKVWSGPKLTEILHVFDPPFLGGGPPPPEFLKSIYKIQSDFDHLAKFQGDRSMELGASVAKQKKTSAAEYKPVRNGGSGRPNKRKSSETVTLTHSTQRPTLIS